MRRSASILPVFPYRWVLVVLMIGLLPSPWAGTAAADDPAPDLPLRRVVVFNSGVGFFERGGTVAGDAEVQLRFDVDDVNDLLKSMVVQDLDGGQVSTVGYGSKDPISKTLKSFAVDLTTEPTLAGLLSQVRGERVVLDAPNEITGVILGLEKRKTKIGEDEVIEQDVLNLLTDGGLQSVLLETVSRIRLTNEALDAELRKALALLATSHDTDKKTVTLHFRGEGDRRVRVGYIQEAPVWKTSYRLVLDEDAKPYLQGWAIVENTTEDDWTNVNLTLVSGRPISFVMDLYDPLYVPRPVVELELYASLRPQTYGQDLAKAEGEFLKKADRSNRGRELAEKSLGLAQARRAAGAPMADAKAEQADKWNFQQGVQSAAAAAEVGELFQYAVDTPVTLPRQQSAMLPIVNADVEGEKLSIYNENVHAKHPLNGLRLKNTTDLHLMQGPITVLDEGVYAGDAKIDDLPPGSERLVSYAMDLDVEVAPAEKSRPEQLLSVRLLKGTMHVVRKYERAKEYTIKNSGSKTKTVLVEYPLDSTWHLVAPAEPAEKTRDRYRFAVQAEPGVPAKLTVEEEYTAGQQIALSNVDDNTVRMYLSASVVSDRVKAALQEVVKRKHEIELLAAKRRQLDGQIKAIGEEQARIRQNMDRLDRTSELYKRYVGKFTGQEDQIESLREQIQELQSQENQLRKSLDEYLMGLDLQ